MPGKKILVVDDSADIVNLLTLKLALKGFEVCSARNGVEAVKKAKSEKPLAIIMDVMMPEMSGFEALQELRDFPGTQNIPVIIISAKDSMKDFFSNVAGVEFMSKPFDLEQLANRVAVLTAGWSQPLRKQRFMMIDSNINFQNLAQENVSFEILKHAGEFKAGKFICNSFSPEDWSLVLSLIRSEERIVPFFGIHPWYADSDRSGWDTELAHVLINHGGAGVGTIGLDKSSKGGDYTKQKRIFLRQLEMAAQMFRPVTIHCDEAWDDLVAFLREHKPARIRFLVRDYQGSPEILEQLTGLGAYISFSRKAFKENAASTAELIRKVRKDKLLLETNFPHGKFQKSETGASAGVYFGELREVYALAAQAMGTDLDEIEKRLWDNGSMFLLGTLPEKQYA